MASLGVGLHGIQRVAQGHAGGSGNRPGKEGFLGGKRVVHLLGHYGCGEAQRVGESSVMIFPFVVNWPRRSQ